jgi:DNA replication protein DnaC
MTATAHSSDEECRVRRERKRVEREIVSYFANGIELPDWLERAIWAPPANSDDPPAIISDDAVAERAAAWLAELEAQLRPERERRRREHELRMRAVPADTMPFLLGDVALEPSGADDAVSDWLASDEVFLTLSGLAGRGKTLAAALACAEDWPHSYDTRPRFVSSKELETVNHYDRGRIDTLQRAVFLVVDDVGVEYADKNGFLLSLLDGLIDSRSKRRLRTIVTTNLGAPEFLQRYGDRIFGRLNQRGVARFVALAPTERNFRT